MAAGGARMAVGVNLPWWHYGWDFGVGPWGPRRPWEAGLVALLRELRGLGVHAVRWFVLGDGITYGTGDAAPREDPTRRWHGHPAWRFEPPDAAATAPLADDFRALLECFRAASEGGGGAIRVLPVVADFHLFFPGNAEAGPFTAAPRRGAPPPAGFVKNGRADIALDPAKTARYVDHLLAPLVAVASEPRLRPFVHAIDLLNEPEWCTDEGRGDPRRTVPLGAMRAFLRACADAVRGRLPTTVGFAEAETLDRWDVAALGLDLWQFHYYARPAVLRRAADFPVPTVVGEFATASGAPTALLARLRSGLWPVADDRTWRELGGAWGDQRLAARLGLLARKGYRECFVWSVRAADKATRWDDAARTDIRRFVAGEVSR